MGTHPIFESDFDCLTELSHDRSSPSETSRLVLSRTSSTRCPQRRSTGDLPSSQVRLFSPLAPSSSSGPSIDSLELTSSTRSSTCLPLTSRWTTSLLSTASTDTPHQKCTRQSMRRMSPTCPTSPSTTGPPLTARASKLNSALMLDAPCRSRNRRFHLFKLFGLFIWLEKEKIFEKKKKKKKKK